MFATVSKNDVKAFKGKGCGKLQKSGKAGIEHIYNIFKRDELE